MFIETWTDRALAHVSLHNTEGMSMLERIKKLLEQLLIPQRPVPVPIPVRTKRPTR
jgi:hypothetical protein